MTMLLNSSVFRCLLLPLAMFVLFSGSAKASRVRIHIPYEAENIPESVHFLKFVCIVDRSTLTSVAAERASNYPPISVDHSRESVAQSGEAIVIYHLNPWREYLPNSGAVGGTLNYTCQVLYLDENRSEICVANAASENAFCRVTDESVTEVSGSFVFRPSQ